QAEDGIRDRNVTGVQTCALPIFEDDAFIGCNSNRYRCDEIRITADKCIILNGGQMLILPIVVYRYCTTTYINMIPNIRISNVARSEERRVGTERRCE